MAKFSKLIKGQNGINPCSLDFSKLLLLSNSVFGLTYPTLVSMRNGIRSFRFYFFKKMIKCSARLLETLYCKYSQPIYSHLLCYISNCNLTVIITTNGSTYDAHWHWGVQFEIKYCFGLYYERLNYNWKCNTAKSCTEYSQVICSVSGHWA